MRNDQLELGNLDILGGVSNSASSSPRSPFEELKELGKIMDDQGASDRVRGDAAARVKTLIVDYGCTPHDSFSLLTAARYHRPDVVEEHHLVDLENREMIRRAVLHEWSHIGGGPK